MTRRARLAVPAATLAAMVALATSRGEAHKPITSPYTYNEDVFPILRDRCGRCHVAGGVAPMSLMTYKDAFPWGESIRTELIAGHMPPGRTSLSAGTFRNSHELSAKELNILLVWVTGGNPMGNADHTPPAVTLQSSWPLGAPDLVVPMPSAFTIAADKTESTEEFTLQTGTPETRLLRAVDLLPGTPAMVRSATISVKTRASDASGQERGTYDAASAAQGAAAERVLAVWLPGESPVAIDGGPAFQLPANAELVLRVHYKKTWEYERTAMTDRSSVGLYFASAGATTLRALTIAPSAEALRALSPSGAGAAPDRPNGNPPSVSFSRVVDEDVEAVALYPDRALSDVDLEVRAERPDGSRAELIRFRPQADWARRYWFASPVALPRGTRVTVDATFDDVLLPPGAAPLVARRPDPSALRLTLNVVGK